MARPYRIGCIGVAGYAQAMITNLDKLIDRDRAVIAAVDVSMSQPAPHVAELLDRHGAARVQGVAELLDHPGLDAVMIPTSIDSHLPFTQMALQRGLHVHCQKPVAGTIDDALAMIEARDKAGKVVAIGFQDHYSTSTRWAKGKILAGAIGKIRRVRLYALWPRPDSYYHRNAWAGALQRNGKWLLDSPAHNALAHQLNLAMYLSNADGIYGYNRATAVEAELYRARDIENCDTCTMRFATEAGCDVLILLTHASKAYANPRVEYVGERGILRRTEMHHTELEIDGKVVESCDDGPRDPLGPMFDNFLDRLDGKVSRVMCEIEDGMEVTRMVNAAGQCAPVRTIDPSFVERVAQGQNPDDCVNSVRDMDGVMKRCFEQFKLPSELGDVKWAKTGGKMDMRGYKHFAGVAR